VVAGVNPCLRGEERRKTERVKKKGSGWGHRSNRVGWNGNQAKLGEKPGKRAWEVRPTPGSLPATKGTAASERTGGASPLNGLGPSNDQY